MQIYRVACLAAVAGVLSFATLASAGTVVVSTIAPTNTTPGVWGVSDARTGTTGSTASIVPAAPAGDPLGPGSALITTDSTNGSMAEIGVSNNYGAVRDVLGNIKLAYSYYKQSSSGNAESAPSLKLTFLNSTYAAGGNDGFVTLVYEPYWNINAGVSTPVPTDTWRTDSIDATHGVFWQTGGFGQSGSGGGPPLKTLADWQAAFDGTSSNAFDAAQLIGVEIGMGSYQPSQIGYFDNVSINGTAVADTTYNFEPAAVPLPSAAGMGLVALGLIGGGALLRRKLRLA